MKKVSIIIPVWNLGKRGVKRVFFSCYSLWVQQGYMDKVIVVDGSTNNTDYNNLNGLIGKLAYVDHVRYPISTFNKPKLLNEGVRRANTKWVFCTDADYVFSKDVLGICEEHRADDRMLHKEVKMLRRINMTTARIDRWKFPAAEYNEWGKLANGAMQYATKDFFTNNPYPEEMEGFGAMDNIMAYMASNAGLKIYWVKEGEILHQYHKVEKFRNGINNKQFHRNQDILRSYIKRNKLKQVI